MYLWPPPSGRTWPWQRDCLLLLCSCRQGRGRLAWPASSGDAQRRWGPRQRRAGPEPAQPVAAGHCTLGTGRRRSSCLARSRAGARDGAAQGHSPGAAAWEQGQDTGGCRGGRRRRRRPRHGVPRRRRRKVRETTNGHGFAKRMTRRRRERRDLPRGGDGFRRRRPRWPEKLTEGSPET